MQLNFGTFIITTPRNLYPHVNKPRAHEQQTLQFELLDFFEIIMDVSGILDADRNARSQLPSTQVQRPLEPDVCDLGNLLLIESNSIENWDNKEQVLKDSARDNTQVSFYWPMFIEVNELFY